MERFLIIKAVRDCYDMSASHGTITIGELRQLLAQFPDDTHIITEHDGGYMFGKVTSERMIYTAMSPDNDLEKG